MKAYLTSIGERTTNIVKEQLERFGFEVVLLNKNELWIDKYKRFLSMAIEQNEDCWRIDADTIPNLNLKSVAKEAPHFNCLMMQCLTYDLYKNNIDFNQPIFYSKNIWPIIKKNFSNIRQLRPETSVWRMNEILPRTLNCDKIVGIHGFFQDKDTIKRARQNKKDRGQMKHYDFDLVDKLYSL